MERGLWHCIGGSDQNHPKEKEMQEGEVIAWGALQIAKERREAKGKGERERYTQENAEFQRTGRRDKKAFFNEQRNKIERNNRMGKIRYLFKKIGNIKGTYQARMGMIKDRFCRDLTEVEEIKKR